METEVQKLVEAQIQPVSSTYRVLKIVDERTFSQPAHSFRYSPTLTRTEKNYRDSEAEIPEGSRMSTAAEELAIQLALERSRQDPRKASVFNDLFARENNGWYAWQWTETGLRIPEGWENGRYQKDEKGNKQYPRIILIGEQVVGEALVPEGDGRVVVEWNEVFGIPSVTSNEQDILAMNKHTTHFYLNSNPDTDKITGKQDVAVGRGAGWHRGGRVGCLDVFADFGRSLADSSGGFRQVQGSVPVISSHILGSELSVVPEPTGSVASEADLMSMIRQDFRNMPLPAFQEKYKL